ncbi:unnamed protein product, partial [Amoebophrya sp. A120]
GGDGEITTAGGNYILGRKFLGVTNLTGVGNHQHQYKNGRTTKTTDGFVFQRPARHQFQLGNDQELIGRRTVQNSTTASSQLSSPLPQQGRTRTTGGPLPESYF